MRNDKELPNGLYCGWVGNGRKNNIFRENNFIYQSKNGNYKKRLPGFKSGDILLLSYNSFLNELSFHKENDNGKLNSFIKNLPKNIRHFIGLLDGGIMVHRPFLFVHDVMGSSESHAM